MGGLPGLTAEPKGRNEGGDLAFFFLLAGFCQTLYNINSAMGVLLRLTAEPKGWNEGGGLALLLTGFCQTLYNIDRTNTACF